MQIAPGVRGAEPIYRLMTGIVGLLPIVWVTIRSRMGVFTLAPFLAFPFVSPPPPMLALRVGRPGPA